MNFSAIEDSVLEETKKFNNLLPRFLKNSRILIILLIVAVITAVSVSIWIKNPEYEVLYNHLSNEDSSAVINQLNQMQIPYKFTDISGQISVPKNKVYDIRLKLAEKNIPRGDGIGFELLDKAKFGASQFNEEINYHRALEGELARTIQRINVVKSARIHIAFPKSSLFLEDKKKSSASVVLELQPGRFLNSDQINAILHLIASSIPNLSVKNITIVDQLGTLLNQPSLGYNQINNSKFKYVEEIESRYSNRIKNILEPLLGKGNIYAQVTAQIDFNAQEKTQEKYSPNTNHNNQSIRSHQTSVHDQIEQESKKVIMPNSLSNSDSNNIYFNKKSLNNNQYKNNLNSVKDKEISVKDKETKNNNNNNSSSSNINYDNTINYELNHSVSHTKMNIGEIKRLSAAVIVNFIKDKNGKYVPLSADKIENIKNLIREAMGYSKSRRDSIHLVNESFAQYKNNMPVKLNNLNTFNLSECLFTYSPWFFSFLLLLILLKKYICPFSKNDNCRTQSIKNQKERIEKNIEKYNLEKNNDVEHNITQVNVQNNVNKDKLIDQISNISNENPRTIALIIRQWMSDKI
ncbi:flagellar basal-body MS-ring/collar protein FliF [Buchnera aphidicola]|uniref:Flagellar M-ring protein n=1 Tax=Buchnera aphidicola (Artemisaphis artemisicola) TaxID=1241836 RepID=A0A4D6XK31_9GAMM|nr:flagellar basal-body MS-ring/collar protein FliF [Buchnera aphidicola]QCI15767.1 flagellar basal body M-ring protein FliF [Buchnera aphidicola (Artemisaphis artemisicola)]